MDHLSQEPDIHCPYFVQADKRHVVCDSLVPRSRAAVVFPSQKCRVAWQRNVCERYEPELVCPYAAALWERDGR